MLRIPIFDRHLIFADISGDGKVHVNDQSYVLGAGARHVPSTPPLHPPVRVASGVTLSEKAWIDLPGELTDGDDPQTIGASVVRLINPGKFQLVFVIRPRRGGELSRWPQSNPDTNTVTYGYSIAARYDLSRGLILRGNGAAYERWLVAVLNEVERKWSDDSEIAARRLTSS